MKRMKLLIGAVLFLLTSNYVSAQKSEDLWTIFSEIDWYQKYSKIYDTQIGFPRFSEKTKALDGKEISLKGYVLPMDTEDGSIIISALPYASCFFCGGAGIETVMAIFLENPRKFDLDEQVTFRGNLQLNEGETGLIYNLIDAEEVEE